MLKVQEYFRLIQTILACIVVCFSYLCWGIPAARSQICQGNMSALTDTQLAQLVNVVEHVQEAKTSLEQDLQAIRRSPQEPLLRQQGFQPSYYAGVDQAREFQRVHVYLLEIQADPMRTHIPYFADQVENIIAEFERGLKKQHGMNKKFLKERLKILEDFKKEAQRRIENQEVTYDWWSNFNLRLALLSTTEDNVNNSVYVRPKGSIYEQITAPITVGNFRTHQDLQETILGYQQHQFSRNLRSTTFLQFQTIKEAFPEKIMFFTTEDLGIIAFNRMGLRSYLVNISGEDQLVDGLILNSFDFFGHDISHAGEEFFPIPVHESKVEEIETTKRLDHIVKTSDRQTAELALFLFWHEGGRRMYEFNRSIAGGEFGGGSQMSIEGRKLLLDKTMREHFTDTLVKGSGFSIILPEHLRNEGAREGRQQFWDETMDIFNEHLSDVLVR